MKTVKDIITSILETNTKAGYALTAREIYNEMEPAEQGQVGSPDTISKNLCNMRNAGIVENGESEVVGGRIVLTWKMKKNEKVLPKAEKTKITVDIQDAIGVAIHDQQETDNAHEMELVRLELPTVTQTEVENVENEMAEAIDDLQNIHLSDSAIETLVRDGYMVLDPMSESDRFICDLVNRLKSPVMPKIGDKDLKIATLENLAPLLSTDIHDVLINIVDDLKGLEAA